MLKELHEKAASAVAAAEAIRVELKAAAEWPAEKQEIFDRAMGEYDELQSQIEKIEKRDARLAVLEAGKEKYLKPAESMPVIPPQDGGTTNLGRASKEYHEAYCTQLLFGKETLTPSQLHALQSDVATAGGYLVPSEEMINLILTGVDNEVFIRPFATKYRVTNADSLGVPVLTADPDDAEWTAEIKTGSADTAMATGKRNLRPNPLAKRIKISKKLLRQVPNAETLVTSRLAYKFGISQEKSFMTGTGANQALGLFTGSALGISTDRDVSTGNAIDDIAADNLIECKYKLKGQYHRRPSTKWLFHRDTVKRIRKLKDGNGDYLWRAGIATGTPDTILDVAYLMSEYVPNTYSRGKYVGIIGDLQFYWIADALDMDIQRVVELYAETNEVGFIGRLECDGMPVLEEAFCRVTLAP